MDKEQIIREAWQSSGHLWRDGECFRVVAMLPITATLRPEIDHQPQNTRDEIVEFRREVGRMDGKRWGRVVGEYQGVEVVVSEGPL